MNAKSRGGHPPDPARAGRRIISEESDIFNGHDSRRFPLSAHTQPKRSVSSFRLLALLGLILCVAGFLSAARTGSRAPQTAKDAETCGSCHEDVAKAFGKTPHSAIGAASCTSCHAGSEIHIKEGGGANILAFKPGDSAARKNKQCLTCHTASNAQFLAGPHGKASLDCTSCHSVHAAKPHDGIKAGGSKTCIPCHQDVYAKFNLNERHRLQEGVLECATCHNPHEPSTLGRLGGFKQELCLKCHTDKGGPFLYEHGSSRVEGCVTCHDPHGTPNRHMLSTSSVADLCFSCHTVQLPQGHGNFNSQSTNCTSCHTKTHGSNLSRIFIK
jgi:DmsE family decaheme c-type cytochrome